MKSKAIQDRSLFITVKMVNGQTSRSLMLESQSTQILFKYSSLSSIEYLVNGSVRMIKVSEPARESHFGKLLNTSIKESLRAIIMNKVSQIILRSMLVILRVLFGLFWLLAGINKINDEWMTSPILKNIFLQRLTELPPDSFAVFYLTKFAIPFYQPIGWFITIGGNIQCRWTFNWIHHAIIGFN